MERKTIIICISVLAALAVAITASVIVLYSDPSSADSGTQDAAQPQLALLSAVPSDASVIACFSSFQDAVVLLSDPQTLFSQAVTDNSAKSPIARFFALLSEKGVSKGGQTLVSLHYSGRLEPLLLVEAGSASADTSRFARELMSFADSCHLSHSLINGSETAVSSSLRRKSVLAVSASETLVNASRRHLDNGTSVLDRERFAQCAASVGSSNALLISHEYGIRTLPRALRAFVPGKSSNFADFAQWTCLSVVRSESADCLLSGHSFPSKDGKSSFVSVLPSAGRAESRIADVVPSAAVSALSYSFSDVSSWLEAYRTFLDANGRLDRYDRSAVSSTGKQMSPRQWAESLNIKEIAKVQLTADDGHASVLYIRTGNPGADRLMELTGCSQRPDSSLNFVKNPYPGYAARVFGPDFEMADSLCVYRKGWIAYCSSDIAPFADELSLAQRLRDGGMNLQQKDVCLWSFTAPSQEQSSLLTFTADAVKLEMVKSEALIPQVLSASGSSVTVNIPEGPFKVTNSGTGKTNLFSQSSNGSLSLREEGGKSLWAIPFSGRLCGSVQNIDYYANGKIQFLFASGDALYLIDRLGRFVKPFPVRLGKEVLLGPGVYDFTGAHGYTAMVLHSDNTIGMYDLHGKLKDGWQGIAPSATVIALPELVRLKDRKYWAVRTAQETVIYPFMGGNPLTNLSGNKRIGPSSAISVKGDALSVTCVDGKTRTIKL